MKRRLASLGAAVVLGTALLQLVAYAASGGSGSVLERLDVSGTGAEANAAVASPPSVSGDGRLVAVASDATNLVGGDTNGVSDVFVRDRGGATLRVSVSSSGEQANTPSLFPAISRDGRHVAFTSRANNLVGGDTNNSSDVFVRDLDLSTTERVDVSSSGEQADAQAIGKVAISGDGRFVAFQSLAGNLAPDGTSGSGCNSQCLGRRDIYVHDRLLGTTERVSVTNDGGLADDNSFLPSISSDGRYVAFASLATNLVPDDTNGTYDVFVRDRALSSTMLASVGPNGGGNSLSGQPSISGDGQLVACASAASNLVPNDTNGAADVFVNHVGLTATERVSVTSAGAQGDAGSAEPAMSIDGRSVAFQSGADLTGQSHAYLDIFVRSTSDAASVNDVSVAADGQPANGQSEYPSISADGSVVTFDSYASNLVADDTNGQEDAFAGTSTGLATTGGTTTGGTTTSGTTTGATGGGGGSTTTGSTTTGGTTTGGTTSGATGDQEQRLLGNDRIDTAIAISQDSYPNGADAAGVQASATSASAVVLARSDLFPDALAGTPLACAQNAPLLITPASALDSRVAAELQRVLGAGRTVYLLGGTNALSPVVEASVRALGYATVRYAGADRYATAVHIALVGLGSPAAALLATGTDFPDALAGGAAGCKTHGAVLLSAGGSMPGVTANYLAAHHPSTFALGGPAAAADPAATPVVGVDRYDTARKAAEAFFSGPAAVGVATGQNFPDALAGGAHIGKKGGPVLLTPSTTLAGPTDAYLRANHAAIDIAFIYGGVNAVSSAVGAQIQADIA